MQKLENNELNLLKGQVGVLSFNIYKKLYHDVKTLALNPNAWKQKYELSLMRILVNKNLSTKRVGSIIKNNLADWFNYKKQSGRLV